MIHFHSFTITESKRNVLSYYRNLGSLRYGNEYCVEDALWEKLLFPIQLKPFLNMSIGSCSAIKTNQWLGSGVERAYG